MRGAREHVLADARDRRPDPLGQEAALRGVELVRVDQPGRLGERPPGVLEPVVDRAEVHREQRVVALRRLGVHASADADRAPEPAGGDPDAAPPEPGTLQVPAGRADRRRGDVVERDRRAGDLGQPARRPRLVEQPDPGVVQVDREQRAPAAGQVGGDQGGVQHAGQRAPRLGPAQPPAVAVVDRLQPHAGPLGGVHAPRAAVAVGHARLREDRPGVQVRLHRARDAEVDGSEGREQLPQLTGRALAGEQVVRPGGAQGVLDRPRDVEGRAARAERQQAHGIVDHRRLSGGRASDRFSIRRPESSPRTRRTRDLGRHPCADGVPRGKVGACTRAPDGPDERARRGRRRPLLRSARRVHLPAGRRGQGRPRGQGPRAGRGHR